MRRSKTERIITISASICLLLVLGCGLLGLGVQQGAGYRRISTYNLEPLVSSPLLDRVRSIALQNGQMNICDGLT